MHGQKVLMQMGQLPNLTLVAEAAEIAASACICHGKSCNG